MAVFKHLVCKGITHLTDERDYDEWVLRMTGELGQGIQPFLKDILQLSLITIQGRRGAEQQKCNCWDFKKCGYAPRNNGKQRTCPACSEERLNGIHGGKNGGRACWAIPRTRCNGAVQRSLRKKQKQCRTCAFYLTVLIEERPDFLISPEFLRMLTA